MPSFNRLGVEELLARRAMQERKVAYEQAFLDKIDRRVAFLRAKAAEALANA